MELQLKNIGMIKEANVKIDGLTIIAGENDTGKSTVGKALFMCLKSHDLGAIYGQIFLDDDRNFKENDTNDYIKKNSKEIDEFINITSYIFQKSIKNDFECILSSGNDKIVFNVDKDNLLNFILEKHNKNIDFNPIFIETPLVWNFTDFFRDIAQIESQMRIKLDYPYLMKDLNFKLHIKSASNGLDIKNKVTSLMGGEFKKDEMGRYYFDKQGQRIELVNTATGIKYFGIFQVLSQNNYLNENTVLVLDEPEVHLHPKWQLEMAKIIVELVKNGVKILVNSHSPYMIEALKRYSEVEGIEDKINFYLAEDGYISQVEDSNSETLVSIYEKLSEPYDEFEKMESERFQNG